MSKSLSERLRAASSVMAELATDAEDLERKADMELYEARDEIITAEGERDDAQERLALLEECVEDLRLGVRDPEEVIELCATRPMP